MKKITIIGSGASGTLLAINLIKHGGSEPLEINLVDKKGRLGRGAAYSTAKEVHLLNVPANKMGAFPDDIEPFYKWLTAQDYDANEKNLFCFRFNLFRRTARRSADDNRRRRRAILERCAVERSDVEKV